MFTPQRKADSVSGLSPRHIFLVTQRERDYSHRRLSLLQFQRHREEIQNMTVDEYVLMQLADDEWWDARYHALFDYLGPNHSQYQDQGIQVSATAWTQRRGVYFFRWNQGHVLYPPFPENLYD